MGIVLEIDTKKSLFDPIEIKIDGKIYFVKELTTGILKKIQASARDAQSGSVEAIQEQIELLLNLPAETFDRLSMSNLQKLISTLVEKSLNPLKGEEKNGSKPGDNQLPS